MAGRLAGKVAIVTGAGSILPGWGNGKAAAVLFAREGARVMVVDKRAEAAEETAGVIRGEGGSCAISVCDVAAAEGVAAMVAQTRRAFGGRIDVLHNNVGVTAMGHVAELAESEWDRVMAVNLKSMFLTCKHVLPLMAEQRSGAVVNVASVAGVRHIAVPVVAYDVSKGAVLPFTRSIAVQYAPLGVRANAIVPGLLDTPMLEAAAGGYAAATGGALEAVKRRRAALVPMGRLGDAWDVAHAAVYLASDEARYVTGAELVVDGGLTCKAA